MESDEALFARMRGGDMAAFDRLYERYEVRLFAYLRALLGNRSDAEEIFHDAFLATLKAAPPDLVRSAFEDLAKQNVQAVVLDLRGCPGGSFDRAVETAGVLLADGAPVVILKRRGKPEETHVAKGGGVLVNLPLAVVVDGNTGSSAELVAAALSENRHARIVGAKTLGKWTVQSVDELSNGWAFKYTVSLFKTPSGRSFEGVGLTPDVEVAMDEKLLAKANATPKPEERLAIDVQLRTAKELLARRP